MNKPAPTREQRLLLPCVLAAFVLAGIVCATGVLLLKYRLEDARAFSMNTVREYIGIDFTFEDLQTQGLRTLDVTGLQMSLPLPGLGRGTLNVAALRLRLSLPELLQGRVAVGEVDIRGARLLLELEPVEKRGGGAGTASILTRLPQLALKGAECFIEVRTKALPQPVLVQDLSFTVTNQPGDASLSGTIQAALSYEDANVDLSLSGRYQKEGNFDVNVAVNGLTQDSISPFVSLPEGFEGALNGTMHAWGNPEQQVTADLTVEADGLTCPGLPVPLEKDAASLNGLVQWNAGEGLLFVRDCKARTSLAAITLGGTLDVSKKPLEMALTAVINELAVEDLIPKLLPPSLGAAGKFDVKLPETVEVRLSASGAAPKPVLSARLLIPRADIAFNPENKKLPAGSLTLTQGDFLWKEFNGLPTGSATLSGGKITSKTYGMEAQDVLGTLVMDGSGISVRPLNAIISGERFAGTASYELQEKRLKFDLNGRFVDIEKTPLHSPAKMLWIEGDVGFHISGTYSREGDLKLKATADVTRGAVAYEWWLRKPAGVGATIQELNVAITPGKKMEIKGEAYVEDTHLLGTFTFRRNKEKWVNEHIRLDIPHLEVNSAGKCIYIPYTATGGACKEGFFEWTAAGKQQGDNISTLGGVFDYISFLPDGGKTPLICRDAQVSVTLTNIKGGKRSGELEVHAAEANVPPFSETWLLPMGSTDPEWADTYTLKNVDKYPAADTEGPRPWVYKLSADTITVPPWEGRNLVAEVYSNEKETGFNFYRAEVGEGRIEGTYLQEKADNVIHLKGTWESIPVKYIIRQLELPEILEGAASGNISYVMDQDDPRTTLRAEGQFSVGNGHFLADTLRDTFKHALSDSLADLHPAALQFDRVSSDLRIEGDHIYTDNLLIQSSGMTIKGNGTWVMEGDMDYRIDIAVRPDMADQIPILRDSFNVEGFRMTQKDIELGFHITGPTFSPTGELAGLPPMGVTLVSGAAEMTGEAMKLLDTPRQMFLSIFRIGGSILGATKTQQQELKRQRGQKR
ncbi:MAG TPA: AsmA-like C-terminal region-containing protein [Candidatus Hydrogenedentes bacterium]|nr:AsmA-like C-terminal region-containing protein [Candidatus Hydrogenedentota bacterium]